MVIQIQAIVQIRPYDSSYYGYGVNPSIPTYSVGTGQNYQFPTFGSAYGSGLYGPSLDGYAPLGFNNRYPNWNQGNSNQYYTGGTGTGLSNPGYDWYRSFRPEQAGGSPVANPHAPMGRPMPGGFPPGK